MVEAEEASRITQDDVVYETISMLPQDQKLILYSIVILTQSGGTYKKLTDGNDTYLFSGEVYNRYKSLAESLKIVPKTERWYRKYISELSMQGLIEVFDSGKGIKGHTKLIKLYYSTKRVREVLESNLFGSSSPASKASPIESEL